jgi:hypothetical protein
MRVLFLIFIIKLSLVFESRVSAMVPPPNQLLAVWGQNMARAQYAEPSKQEPSLATICQTKQYSTIIISGVMSWNTVKNYPVCTLFF